MSSEELESENVEGFLAIRTIAMPKDTNDNGDIFGGWLISQMDLAAASVARRTAHCRVTTVALDSMVFLRPVHVGDAVGCYGELLSIGRTSMKIRIKVWVVSPTQREPRQVTEGIFTYVAIDDSGHPIPVKREGENA